MEKDPWWKHVEGPFLTWEGPKGVKRDGGGCTRGQGKVSDMRLWRAAHNRNAEGERRSGVCLCWACAR